MGRDLRFNLSTLPSSPVPSFRLSVFPPFHLHPYPPSSSHLVPTPSLRPRGSRIARPPHRGVGELLAELDARLIEGIDPVPLSGVPGRDLIEHQQLAEGRGAEVRQPERAAHAAHLRERRGGGVVFGVE